MCSIQTEGKKNRKNVLNSDSVKSINTLDQLFTSSDQKRVTQDVSCTIVYDPFCTFNKKNEFRPNYVGWKGGFKYIIIILLDLKIRLLSVALIHNLNLLLPKLEPLVPTLSLNNNYVI